MRKIVEIRVKAIIKAGSKVKAQPKIKAKFKAQVESILLTSLSSLLKLTNLDYINSERIKPDTKYVGEFFLCYFIYFDKIFF